MRRRRAVQRWVREDRRMDGASRPAGLQSQSQIKTPTPNQPTNHARTHTRARRIINPSSVLDVVRDDVAAQVRGVARERESQNNPRSRVTVTSRATFNVQRSTSMTFERGRKNEVPAVLERSEATHLASYTVHGAS